MKLKRLALCFGILFFSFSSITATGIALAQSSEQPPEPVPTNPEITSITPIITTTASDKSSLQAELLLFERAYNEGPEAVVALRDNLSSEALDILMDEIHAAEEQVAQLEALPQFQAEQVPISPEEEQIQQDILREHEANNRVRILTVPNDPTEGHNEPISALPQSASPAHIAADLTVGNGCTYATIASALDAANPGDRLLLEGGHTFTENLNISKNIMIEGGYDGCTSGSTVETTIDGANINRVINIFPGLNVALTNIVLINGNVATEGGAIRFAPDDGSGSLTLDNITLHDNTAQWGGGLWAGVNTQVIGTNVEIYNNTASSYGGGIRLFGGQVVFTDTKIFNNVADYGGGVYASKNSGYTPQLHLPSYADIFSNEASTSGGGLYFSEGTIEIRDCSDVYSNNSESGGGATLITSTLTVNGGCSEIENNTTTGDGGGIYAQGSTINLEDAAEVWGNTAGSDGSGSGGGIYLDNSDFWGDKVNIRSNQAANFGGGIFATNNSSVDMDLGSYSCLGTRCSQLTINTATNGYGGGIYAVDSDVDLRQTFIEDNTAAMGGGAYVNNSSLELYNNLFAENDATGGTGDGLRVYTDAEVVGNGNTYADNNAGGSSTGQAIALYDANLTLGCSIIWGHTTSISEGGTNTTAVTYSDIQGGFSGTGNVNINPQFVAPSSDDYHLGSASPVIDRCSAPSGMTHDFENEVRPIRQISEATPYDMGADEYSVPHVGINGNGCSYGTITQAAEAAADDDTIQVAAGTFYENVVMQGDKSVTITGGYDSNCTTPDAGTTVINGSAGTNSVFRMDSVTAVLSKLAITGGNTTHGGGIELQNAAQVTLDNTRIHDNQANFGGGIYITNNSALTLTNDSDIDNNTATTLGGGIRIYQGQLTGADNASDIHNNNAAEGGGIAVTNGGILNLAGSDLYQNQATATLGRGGGILLEDGSTLDTSNFTYIYYLNKAYDGAGIYADASTITMDHNTFRQNIATNNGGAIYMNNSTLSATDSNIGQVGATLANEAVWGAGIFAVTSTVNFEGVIINNIAESRGGGIYAEASTLNLNAAQIGGTNEYEPNQITETGFGAGIYLDAASQATLQNTVVASNTLQTTGAGGGLYVNNSNVMLIDSRVEHHTASSIVNGRGAGIYASGSHVTLDNSQILSNTAALSGGGIRLYGSGSTTLTLINDSIIRNNESLTAEGGGIAANGNTTITLSDATLRNNAAATDGGGISVNGGTLDFTGGLTLRSNDAEGNGGAIAASGGVDIDFNLQSYSLIYDNTASTGNGGAFYFTNNDMVNLNITGNSVYVYANSAGNHGGAAFVGDAASLTTRGTVNFDRNWAYNGHGGAIYADAGTLAFDADGAASATLWDNRAATGDGGAVYATNGAAVRCNQAEFGKEDKGNLSLAGSGGSLSLNNATLESNNCKYLEGQAAMNGGSIAAYDSAITITTDETTCDPATNRCSEFMSNIADSDGDNTGYGGAIYSEDSHVVIEQTTLHDNSAVRGGALYHKGTTVQNAHTTLENTLIYSNTVSEAFGAGVRTSYVHITATHVTLANNMGGAAFSPSSSEAWVSNSIAWGNSQGGFVRTYVYTDCVINQGDNAGEVGLNIDPEFVDAGAGEDYHLAKTSPAIDACLTGLDEDLDDVVRPTGDGYEMGAYEYIVEDYFVYLPMIIK